MKKKLKRFLGDWLLTKLLLAGYNPIIDSHECAIHGYTIRRFGISGFICAYCHDDLP